MFELKDTGRRAEETVEGTGMSRIPKIAIKSVIAFFLIFGLLTGESFTERTKAGYAETDVEAESADGAGDSGWRRVKLLIIGFDGMDYHLTKMTLDEERFDFPLRIFPLRVDVPLTGPSWATFYTGLNASVHGVTDYWGRAVKSSNCFEDIEEYTFWKLLEKHGYESFLFNLPITPEGFPFDDSPEKDIINWDYDALKQGPGKWRQRIREMPVEEVIRKAGKDAFGLIDQMNFGDADMIFVQFSFLDRIGHTLTYKKDKTVRKAYDLAYLIIDELHGRLRPEYFMVVSDHGFGRRLPTHFKARTAVLLSDENMSSFLKRRVPGRHFLQTALFDEILALFGIEDYQKPRWRIDKKTGRINDETEEEEIRMRLKGLGYIQ